MANWPDAKSSAETRPDLQYSRLPLSITFSQMIGWRITPSARIDHPLARISSCLVLCRIPRIGSLLLPRDRNRMDSVQNDDTCGTEPHHSS